jgi:hypothetical protein
VTTINAQDLQELRDNLSASLVVTGYPKDLADKTARQLFPDTMVPKDAGRVTRRGWVVLSLLLVLATGWISYETRDICFTGTGYGSCSKLIDGITK